MIYRTPDDWPQTSSPTYMRLPHVDTPAPEFVGLRTLTHLECLSPLPVLLPE